MKKLEELVCSWQQGKRLEELNINVDTNISVLLSIFKWVHPYQLYKYIENKRKYILVERFKIANRSTYPAYTLEELLQLLPNDYILGRCGNRWFCMPDYVPSATIDYERTAIDACFNALVRYTLRGIGSEKLKSKIEEKDMIKIRYAYITSLTNAKEDPFYRENLTFRTLTIKDLEAAHGALKDLLTLEETALIRILGRDICTGRTDKNGKDIYEGDIIRWGLDSGDYIDETIHRKSHFAELDSERDCEVIGTIYDKADI